MGSDFQPKAKKLYEKVFVDKSRYSKYAADDRKREFLVDLNLDTQAQRAVLDVLKRAKVDAETVAEYKPFAHSFDK